MSTASEWPVAVVRVTNPTPRPTEEALRRRRLARSRRARRRGRRRLVALLLLVALVSFFAWLAVRLLTSPGGFDHHFRPNHIERYSNAELDFSLQYPASMLLRHSTIPAGRGGERGVRLVFAAEGEGAGALAVTVHEWSREHRFSRDEAAALARDLRSQIAATLPRTYRRCEGVRGVRVEGVQTTTVAGLPAIASRAEFTMSHGTVVKLERGDCFSGRLVFTFEAAYAKGDAATQKRLRAIVASLYCDADWRLEPAPRETWVMALPSPPAGAISKDEP